ncbi:MAG: hypothetical protein E7603_01765 [Ruminococcaceae bacterium]|nr:hypothetical protein [Oscillospiraceae bacterium]
MNISMPMYFHCTFMEESRPTAQSNPICNNSREIHFPNSHLFAIGRFLSNVFSEKTVLSLANAITIKKANSAKYKK